MSRKHHIRFKELDQLYETFKKASKEVAGYPISQFFDYSDLFHFLKFHINNLGDPFRDSWHYKINTLEKEKEVIDSFAKLFHAPKDSYWGYVTNGGTEGNLYGMYIARELYPEGVVFYSDQTHYSIPKILRLLKIPSIKVKTDPHGELNYVALQNALIESKKTPIIMANIGTTMKGAVDDILKIKETLNDLNIQNYYIHCDAAFFGMILPFISGLKSQSFDFRMGIDSIAVSGHKLVGTPIPCGVVLTKKAYLDKIGSHIEYTGAQDNTITGSRNGLTPLFLWYELHCAEEGNFEEKIRDCIEKASYAVKKFNDCGIRAWKNLNSIIVVFPRPSESIIKKWQLAVEGEIAHIITLPHLSTKVIDQIVKEVDLDLKKRKPSKKTLNSQLP